MLVGLRIVEISQNPAVRFCGSMFAGNGASVTRVAVAAGEAGTDQWSDGFLDAGKDVLSPHDVDLDAVLATADVVIAEPDFDWARVTAACVGHTPVTGTVDAFGVTGPYAGWRASELILSSLGGATLYTVARDGTPVYGYGDRYQYLTGVYLYTAVASCLLTKLPQDRARVLPFVRVSAFESVVSLLPYLTTQFEYNGSQSTQEQSGPRFVSRCSDGFVVIYAGREWADVAAVLGDPALEYDERFVNPGSRFAHVAELNDLFDAWCSVRSVANAAAIGEEHEVAITAVRTPAFMLNEPTFAGRDGWREVGSPAGPGRVPALPYTVDGKRSHIDVEVAR